MPTVPILASKQTVVKRDGRTVPYDFERVLRAISLAFYEVRYGATEENAHRDVAETGFGLDPVLAGVASDVAKRVDLMVDGMYYAAGKQPTIEQIQDVCEMALFAEGKYDVAKAFVLYRKYKADRRLNRYPDSGISDYVVAGKYAQWIPGLKRRETLREAANRDRDMHLRRFLGDAMYDAILPESKQRLRDMIIDSFDDVANRRVMPSMRSLQFGGSAIEANNARMYNCSFSYANRKRFFAEAMELLLAGSGVGFSVQRHHIDQIPSFPHRGNDMELPVRHFDVPDTIEGWADAVDELIESYFGGYYVEFSFRLLRPRGTRLKTSGGKAPGHRPLKKALENMRRVLDTVSGRKMRPIEAYDIVMFFGAAVLSGGIRRTATICLFSADDEEMANAKTGDWMTANPQRGRSNNSAVLVRGKTTFEQFKRLFECQKGFGEPGFYFVDDPEYGTNPCVEIGLYPTLKVDSEEIVAQLRAYGYSAPVKVGDVLYGWQFCNLTIINGLAARTEDDFYELCQKAAFIGTLQASYTDIPYLGAVTRIINEREALLGVSISGLMDNPEILLNGRILAQGAKVVRKTNEYWAGQIGTRPAARTTCVKPDGTVPFALATPQWGIPSSGIHPHHAGRSFRRVQANRLEPVYQHFRKFNPQMCEPSVYTPETDDIITFPIEAPPNAILRTELTAVQFLDAVRLVQQYWVEQGRAYDTYAPGLHHNVSNTTTVRDGEWEEVAQYIWDHRNLFTGIALLHDTGDKIYPQAPREALATEEDVRKWNRLQPQPVDYTTLIEEDDATELKDSVACAGGACDISAKLA